MLITMISSEDVKMLMSWCDRSLDMQKDLERGIYVGLSLALSHAKTIEQNQPEKQNESAN